MKRFVACALLLGVLFFNSCGKTSDTGCQPVSVSTERPQLIAFCTANNITYTEHSSGLFYQILSPGSGATPVSTSSVSVTYTGTLLTGTIFDSTSTPVTLVLSTLIDGWKIGLPLIQKGGHIKLVIPSALAWSCSGSGTKIPANSPVFFDITLTDVK
jgi:FKBP-type peptidyl-prolyl cis-trans isomerase